MPGGPSSSQRGRQAASGASSSSSSSQAARHGSSASRRNARHSDDESDEEEAPRSRHRGASQRAAAASQREPEEAADHDNEEEADGNDKARHALSKDDLRRKATDIVRYCVFAARKQYPIVRADINKTLLAGCAKADSDKAMEIAKQTLLYIFGFELVDLDARLKAMPRAALAVQPADDASTATSQSKPSATQASQSSQALPGATAAGDQARKRQAAAKKLFLWNSIRQGQDINLVSWDTEQQAKRGLLMLVLSLIYIRNEPYKESGLWISLKNVGVIKGKIHPQLGDVEKVIQTEFVRQNYLQREKSTVPIEPGAEPDYFVSWGTRAIVEFPLESLIEFMAPVLNMEVAELRKDWIHSSE
ncbi:hypothetical protein CAOG_03494 [Capsaspora owczarzaki ATCC 30864]|uniref:MAGE domain-containing protein n=1 Tax=Capsaspora owczarzaki (strain ATCC 30864) TaxID=595528 RepID=A0A0D2WPG7_CAPO3|nr:hypothetical protein CAOG_03494 [Capsaspora owczarzaki ATCC 30864]KJE92548.1 hypothetical protein CAOG_003494 [Capsaspora owczarzaki ATCC 30864]|eukprot:XP_004348399.1 hypothetical protein CAOG_03494 [Capsaspora owczarzaki ATCC 30864]